MPDYKKKRVNRLRGAPKPRRDKPERNTVPDEIVMTPESRRARPGAKSSESAVKESAQNLKVVKGRKLERRRKTRILLTAAAIAVIICTVLHFILPVGIIENVGNLIAVMGSGSYPVELESSEVVSAVSRGSYYYVLTDTRINAYSGAGKEIYSYAHGFENPVLKTSKTRALVFSQGGSDLLIYNLQSLKGTLQTEKPIITACISDSGAYAVVTQSDSYAAAVSVYGKNGKLMYEWFSASDTVNNIAISPDGKKIAVSLFNATSGAYSSKISVYGFESADPLFTKNIDGSPVYGLDSTHNSGFFAVSQNKLIFVKWSDYNVKEYDSDYNAAMFRAGSGGAVAVFNRESDRTDNRIVLFNTKGEKISEFEFKQTVSDIQVSGGHIYCMSDTEVFLLSDSGEKLRSADCGFGAVWLAVTGSNEAAVITDNRIDKVKLVQ